MEIQKSKHLRVKNENFQAIYLGSTNYFIYFWCFSKTTKISDRGSNIGTFTRYNWWQWRKLSPEQALFELKHLENALKVGKK